MKNPSDCPDSERSEHLVRQRFGQETEWYAQSAVHSKSASLARLVELAEPGPGERFLDVATGTGHSAGALKAAQARVTVFALDLTHQMLVRAEKDYGVHIDGLVQAAAGHLPFAAGSFQGVVSRSAPHHFPDVPSFLQETARLLAPGGRLVISDCSSFDDPEIDRWLQEAEIAHDSSHLRNYPLSEWRKMIDSSPLCWDQGDTNICHSRTFSSWMQVVKDPETVSALRRKFLEAPKRIRQALQMRIEGRQPGPPEITFDVPQAIFRAIKPG